MSVDVISKKLRASAAIAVVLSSVFAPSRAAPAALSAAAAKARLNGTVLAWCAGEFRRGHAHAFAVAIAAPAGEARYIVIERDGTTFDLASFKGQADLSCYTPAQARRLNANIAASETIHGNVNPRWPTTVICGFVEATHAVCWQFSPTQRGFVKIGEWTT
jgi:hypothetical protein